MFWASVATIVRLFTRSAEEASESSAPEAIFPSETQEKSTTQRESSDTISQASLREWPSAESLLTGSSFSEAMSDSVTVDQQRREEQNATALNSPVSEERIRTGQWIKDNRGELAGLWPNSNQTAVDVTPVRAGCTETPKNNDSPASKDTNAILEGMTYVGGMNYAKCRLEACRAKTSGKQRALARLADTHAECNEQHKVMTAELEAMQDSVKCSLRSATQQTTVQAAKVDAMGHRLNDMKDLLLQRELRIEVRLAKLSDQMRTLGAVSQATTPEVEQTEVAKPVASTSKMVPMRSPNPPITLKACPKTEPKVFIPPVMGTKTTKVHVCTPNSLSAVPMPSMTSPGSRPYADHVIDH